MAFDSQTQTKLRNAFDSALDLMGLPAEWHQAKPPQATVNVTAGFKTASWKDEELVNAFGIGAKVFTIKVSQVPVIEKFDQLVVSGERYTIDSVMPVHINGIHVYHKCYVKGK